jgi:beta-phosphoglucomutase
MPGVEDLLNHLQKHHIARCVVTNSFRQQVELIRSKLPLLNTIPHWITREDYKNPKPHPEGYLKAIELYGKKGGKVVGFEDTVRGLEALRQTSALPVLICSEHHPLLAVARQGRGLHFPSFRSIQDLH